MATILVYNNATGKMETYSRALTDSMPYNTNRTLSVREFKARSCSEFLWTTTRAMDSWNRTRSAWGRPINVGAAFKRIWEGGHSSQSQHYAGTSFDVAQSMSANDRNALRNLAISLGVWTYVEPAYLTPTWVHFDARASTSACPSGGYPLLSQGSVGTYVLVLQDALNTLGFTTYGMDGIFGANTASAVRAYQSANRLTADGIVGCATWRAITTAVLGIGSRIGTVHGCL